METAIEDKFEGWIIDKRGVHISRGLAQHIESMLEQKLQQWEDEPLGNIQPTDSMTAITLAYITATNYHFLRDKMSWLSRIPVFDFVAILATPVIKKVKGLPSRPRQIADACERSEAQLTSYLRRVVLRSETITYAGITYDTVVPGFRLKHTSPERFDPYKTVELVIPGDEENNLFDGNVPTVATVENLLRQDLPQRTPVQMARIIDENFGILTKLCGRYT